MNKKMYHITMKSVVEYQDYHTFLGEVFVERKARAGFTWREFAKLAGYASPVYLKLVADGKSRLSELGVERVASALGIVGKELQYFRLLVQYNHSQDREFKKQIWSEMRAIAEACQVTVVGAQQYDYYKDWYNPVVRELAAAFPESSAEELAHRLQPAVTVAKVRKSLELLQKIGLLSRDAAGHWVHTSNNISTGADIASLAVRDMHRQMAALGALSLDSVPVAERDISGLTLGLSAQGFERVCAELRDFRHRIVEITESDSPTERVYRMNLQLFPLSRGGVRGGSND